MASELGLGLELGLGEGNCLTRTRLLCQKERGQKKHTESKRSWASEEGEIELGLGLFNEDRTNIWVFDDTSRV